MSAISMANQPPKKWTLLYYFDGKNNLASMAQHSFNSLDSVGSSKDVNLVAQLGLPKQKVMQGRLEANAGTAGFQSIGRADMGSADNVQKFVEWGMKNYPAENYALVMWDHGAGFKGSMTDDETNHIIANKDLAAALEAAQKNTGKKLEVINFNACLMNQAEVGYELRNSANYMVGSEEVEAGLRIPIPKLFGTTPQHLVASDVQSAIDTKGSLSGEELAKLFVFESKNQFGQSLFTPTQAAVDLSKMDALRDKTEQLSGLLHEAVTRNSELVDTLRSDIKKTQHYLAADMYIEPYVDYRDIGDFCRVIEKNSDAYGDPRIATAARELMASVQESVIAEAHVPSSGFGGRSLEGSTGLSVYLPRDYGFDKAGKSAMDNVVQGGTHGHELTSFAENSNWTKMLQAVAKDDDIRGKFPKLQRTLMNVGQISSFYGYDFAWRAISGATTASGLTLFPLMGFPYFLPLPGQVAAGIGIIGGALKVSKGLDKLVEGIQRSDSPAENRRKLVVDGVLDTAIGAGSILTCGALLAGIASPMLVPVAAGTLALGVGRMVYNLAKGLIKHKNAGAMDVQQKIDAMADTRPKFSSLEKNPLPPAAAPAPTPAAPATKTAPQPPAAAPAPAAAPQQPAATQS